MDSYTLSRNFFNWSFENPELVAPYHVAIYFFAVEHCNRLGWKEKFGFPSQMAMEAVGISRHQTYIKYFNNLVEWDFLKLISKSKNQYSSNIISLIFAMPKNDKALDKALLKHASKQSDSNRQSKRSIDKQLNNKQTNKEQTNKADPFFEFEFFWKTYDKNVGRIFCENLWCKIPESERIKILEYVPRYVLSKPEKKFRKNPENFLIEEIWRDEIITNTTVKKFSVKPKEISPEETKRQLEIYEILKKKAANEIIMSTKFGDLVKKHIYGK